MEHINGLHFTDLRNILCPVISLNNNISIPANTKMGNTCVSFNVKEIRRLNKSTTMYWANISNWIWVAWSRDVSIYDVPLLRSLNGVLLINVAIVHCIYFSLCVLLLYSHPKQKRWPIDSASLCNWQNSLQWATGLLDFVIIHDLNIVFDLFDNCWVQLI